jgi:hypothetical protein
MKAKAASAFAREVDLCAAFIEAVRYDHDPRRRYPNPAYKAESWTSYPETGGWDILLVRDVDGFQVGVEAKLRLNPLVLAQALEHAWPGSPGPDCRAVLVPTADRSELVRLCAYVGVTILTLRERYEGFGKSRRPKWEYRPALPHLDREFGERDWFELLPLQRHRLPQYVPDSVAGSPSPVRLTTWKIGAMKIAIILEKRPVTRADFKALEVDHRFWIAPGRGLLVPDPDGRGWIWGERGKWDFETMHPRNYAEVKADAEKWMPKGPLV